MWNPALHGGIVAILVIAIPLWDRYESRRLRADLSPANRIRCYRVTIGVLWSLTALLVLTVPWQSLTTPILLGDFVASLKAHRAVRAGFWSLTVAILVGIVAPVIAIRRRPEARESMLAPYRALAFFLPGSAPERRWFAGVSLSAGICEEIIYRGFLVPYLAVGPLAMGPVPAILVAAVIFGMAHGYQGWVGMIATGVIALVMTVLFLLSGSLWLPMVVHTLLDLRVLAIWDGSATPQSAPLPRSR